MHPPVSILKPLCGLDDELAENLLRFARLDYPAYEVVLGLRSAADPAWPLACSMARRWPERFSVVLQRGAPGLNPKVNQLLSLERAAQHEILVVSDSNVRVAPGYLREIAALLEDPEVGLVTHLVAGSGAVRSGSVMDQLHLAGAIAPGVVSCKHIAGRDLVVGKSMALRRPDLVRMGGFGVVKDVLAEDYVLGRMVSSVLGKRVELARHPIENVSVGRTVAEFTARYQRWGIMQCRIAGSVTYAASVLLLPLPLAFVALVLHPSLEAICAFGAACVAKIGLDGLAVHVLRPAGARWRHLALVPLKDFVFAFAWAQGLVRRTVDWRGHVLRVLRGTRLVPAASLPSMSQLAHDLPPTVTTHAGRS